MPEQQARIELKGLQKLLRNFGAAPGVVKRLATEGLEEASELVKNRLAGYTQTRPPKPPGSTYRRTFRLQRSIEKEVVTERFLARVGTDLYYAPYVIGKTQAAIHRGRWYTIETVAEEKAAPVGLIFSQKLAELAEELVD